MPSCIASSFSHGLAFISSKPERTITFTSSPPEAARRAAAVHGGVAAAEHDHALRHARDVAERDGGEPVDADVDVLRGLLAPGNVEVPAARRARAHEDRVVAVAQQFLQRLDALVGAEVDAQVEDVAHFLVDHALGEAEPRDLRADHAAGALVGLEHRDLVAERREVARHGERGGAGADAGDALAVLLPAGLRQPRPDVVLVVGGDALQAADRDRLGLLALVLLDAAAPAGGLAGPVAGAPEDAGEDVRLPVDHVGVAVAPCAIRRMYSGTGVWAGQAHWQSTTLWK